tara:strand:+ start:246 stop:755 length:510 start_codon:yes stop_codon:yes gene_type:complete
LINNYNSCEGKGFIVSKGEIHGKLYFSFKSQRDSTFIDFSDFLGRKTILMWVSPGKITVRDLINNKYYSYDQVINYFPFLRVLDTQNISEVVWGSKPVYKKNIKKYKKKMSLEMDYKFKQKQLSGNRLALSSLYYNDRKSGDSFQVEFKSRQWSKNHINMKKFWKMLEF